jgi:hypothetical protein
MWKKRLILLLLASVLLVTSFGCRSRREEPTDTASSAEQSTPEETTKISTPLPPTPPPDPTVVGSDLDMILLDGEPLLSGDQTAAELERLGYTLSVSMDLSPVSLTLCGWVGFRESIDTFGYRLDGREAVFGHFAIYTEEAVQEAGGEYARRYAVTVPLFDLRSGAHTVELLARLADGSVKTIIPTLTLVKEGLIPDLNRPFHSSVTQLNGQGPDGAPAYEGRGGSIDRGVDVMDATLSGIAVSADCRLRLSGWMALEGGVERYVWSADGSTWYTALSGSADGEPSEGYYASLGYESATENALFTDLTLDLSPIGGRLAWITVGAIPKDAPDCVVPFFTLTGLNIPFLPVDIGYGFATDVHANPTGTELHNSDLAAYFEISYGAGDIRRVDLIDGEPAYLYEGIHSFQALMGGTFAMTATVQSMGRSSFFFVRGHRQMLSVDEVPIPLANFYETDGAGLCGGAGIYARLDEGTLTLVVKGLDPNTAYHVRNYVYEIPAEGDQLTLADDGMQIFCYVNGKLMATVCPAGSAEYPDYFTSEHAYGFAETATVTLADGRTDVIHDTLIAATCFSQAGAATRGGHIHFSKLTVTPLAELEGGLK